MGYYESIIIGSIIGSFIGLAIGWICLCFWDEEISQFLEDVYIFKFLDCVYDITIKIKDGIIRKLK